MSCQILTPKSIGIAEKVFFSDVIKGSQDYSCNASN